MAIDTPCRDYRNNIDDWKRMRDVMAGQSTMRLNAAYYLRRASGMTDDVAWGQYVLAAPFFEATGRTREGLSGLAFYREPEFTLPDGMADFVKDATQDGVSLQQFTKRVFDEILTVNRAIVVVDYPTADPNIRTARDAELANRRPFLRQYLAEELFSWTETSINGVRKLTQARVWEVEVEPDPVDEFAVRWRYRIRVFELVPTAQGSWIYRQRIYVTDDWQGGDEMVVTSDDTTGTPTPVNPFATGNVEPGGEWAQLGDPVIPTIDGAPLDYLPLWIINATDQSSTVMAPPLLPLANVNISHFNTSACLENALFWCGNPTPYVTGVDPQAQTDLMVGSSKAWLLADAQSKADFLSYGADNLAPLEKRLDRFENHMAVLGARLLSPDKAGVEAADTARIHRQGEISVLAGICGSTSSAMTDVCDSATAWAGQSGTCTIKIHTTFYDAIINSLDAINFLKLWQSGVIAYSDLLSLLKKGEIVAGDRTADDIASENQSSVIQPQLMPGLTSTGPGGGGADTQPTGAASPPGQGTKPAAAQE